MLARFGNRLYDENCIEDLLIWSVLNNQQEMAELFWRRGKDAIAAALVASALFSAVSHQVDETELIEELEANVDEFTKLAIGVLKEGQSIDGKKAQYLLSRRVLQWGDTSCILIAVRAKNERFISQTECQNLFKSIWKGEMTQKNGTLRYQTKKKSKRIPSRGKTNTSSSYGLLQGEGTKDDSGDETKVDVKCFSIVEKFPSFYRAPVVVFCHNVISYMVFLCLYSYVLICKLEDKLSVEEIILIVWMLTFVAEEIRQVNNTTFRTLKAKFLSYIMDGWNKLDVLTIALFVIGMILKALPHPQTLEAARIFLGVDLIMCFLRMLHIFRVHKELGPKLMMIIRAAQSLMYFFVIIMEFIVAYAIASHAMLYPNADLNLDSLIAIFRRPYWNIYGELMLDEIEGSVDCTNDAELYRNGTYPRCPTVSGKYFGPVLMGLYMLMCNVLLLNLLIVVFTGAIEDQEYKTNLYWNLQLNNLIDEYYNRSILAPPLTLIEHIFRLINLMVGKCQGGPVRRRNALVDHSLDETELRLWEARIADTFHHERNVADHYNMHRVHSTALQVDQLVQKIDKLQKKQQTLTESIEDVKSSLTETIEDVQASHSQNDSTTTRLENMEKQLQWIIDSLIEHHLGAKREIPEAIDPGLLATSLTAFSKLPLHAAHSYFHNLVAEKFDASFLKH